MTARQWISVLGRSHDRLAGVVSGLTAEQVTGPSYCDDWSVAQVLSHLGSGAEIGLANLESALAGGEPPSRDRYQEIWDRWNAKSPEAMAADALVADQAHVARCQGLSDAELDSVTMEFMGRTLDATGIVGLRLGEHVVHTWDVAVVTDPSATLPEDATALLVDVLPPRAGFLARGDKPAAAPVELSVAVAAPERSYVLRIGDEVALEAGSGGEGRVSLTGDTLFRLVYGRLDAAHTPASTTASGPVSLDELRALYPGF